MSQAARLNEPQFAGFDLLATMVAVSPGNAPITTPTNEDANT